VLSKDLFLCEQDIRNVVSKLAKKTYKQHDNDSKNVRMWVKDNQMPWQKETMLTHGHEKEVVIHATFGTNENKVHPLNFMSILVELDYFLFKFNVPRYVIVQLWNIHIEFKFNM
jgi:hypothetical protein